MQIILEEDEIKAALVAYATSMITVKEDQEITIDMKAGRGENGYSATLNIQPKPAPVVGKTTTRAPKTTPVSVAPYVAAPTPAPAKALFAKPVEVVAEPQPEPEAVEEPLAGISTGEDRGEAEDAIQANIDEAPEAAPATVAEEAPVEKPKSIFNFAKPAAAAGA